LFIFSLDNLALEKSEMAIALFSAAQKKSDRTLHNWLLKAIALLMTVGTRH